MEINLRKWVPIGLSVALAAVSLFEGFMLLSPSSQIFIRSQASMGEVAASAYWDVTSTARATSIDWGTLSPGQNMTVTIYLRNEGSVDLNANITTINWVPTQAAQYLTLSWNWPDYPLSPNRSRKVLLTLTVSSRIWNITRFTFDIVITVWEVSS